MNDIQKRLVELLREIDEICIKNNIPYLLHGRTARDAFIDHGFTDEYMNASVIMMGHDFDKFRAAVKAIPGRAIESITEYDDYTDGMSMRYVDETTTFMYGHTAHNYHLNGIYVKIEYCRYIPQKPLKAKIVNGTEKLISYSVKKECGSLSPKKQKLVKFIHVVQNLLGRRTVLNILLKIHNNLIPKTGPTLAYVRPLSDNINIPISMFENVVSTKYGDYWFNLPSQTEKYLDLSYKKSWKSEKKLKTAPSLHLLVASADVSYKEIIDDNSIRQNAKEIEYVIQQRTMLNNKIKSLRAKIEHNWDILFLTQERYRLYKEFMPVLDIVKDYYDRREYQWLLVVMKHYLDIVEKYADKGWPVAVSDELDEIVFNLLYRSGRAKAAIKFNELKSKVKLKSINVDFKDKDYHKAISALVPVIVCGNNNEIPVFLHIDDKYFPVKLAGADGELKDLFEKESDSVKKSEDIGKYRLVIQTENENIDLINNVEWCEKIFREIKTVCLVQNCFEKDIVIAYLESNGFIHVASKFVDDILYEAIEPLLVCEIKNYSEVPVYRLVAEELREVFCMNDQGERKPFITVGLGGNLIINDNAAECLYYQNENGIAVRWNVFECFDVAHDNVYNSIFAGKSPVILEKFVQKDAFGRIIEMAAIIDNGNIVPLGMIAENKTFIALDISRNPISTLCIKQSDGRLIPVANIDSSGKIVSAKSAEDYVSLR